MRCRALVCAGYSFIRQKDNFRAVLAIHIHMCVDKRRELFTTFSPSPDSMHARPIYDYAPKGGPTLGGTLVLIAGRKHPKASSFPFADLGDALALVPEVARAAPTPLSSRANPSRQLTRARWLFLSARLSLSLSRSRIGALPLPWEHHRARHAAQPEPPPVPEPGVRASGVPRRRTAIPARRRGLRPAGGAHRHRHPRLLSGVLPSPPLALPA